MGLFSSKSSSTTNNFDTRGAADNGSLVATGESTLSTQTTITNISQSKEALDTVSDAIRAGQSTSKDAFGYSSRVIGDALDQVRRANEHADEIAKMALGQAKDISRTALGDATSVARTAMDQAQSRHENDMTEIAKTAVPLVIAVIGLWVWSNK